MHDLRFRGLAFAGQDVLKLLQQLVLRLAASTAITVLIGGLGVGVVTVA